MDRRVKPGDDELQIRSHRMNTQFLIQLLVNGLVVGTLYGVVAMSFVLIYKATQVVNFAQGELLLVGAWVCWALLAKYEVPFWIGMPMTLVFMFVFGIAIQVLILRPMIGEPAAKAARLQLSLPKLRSREGWVRHRPGGAAAGCARAEGGTCRWRGGSGRGASGRTGTAAAGARPVSPARAPRPRRPHGSGR